MALRQRVSLRPRVNPVSLWRMANARNVRLYYPYRQYTNHFIFRFVSLLCLRSALRLFKLCLDRFDFSSHSSVHIQIAFDLDLSPIDLTQYGVNGLKHLTVFNTCESPSRLKWVKSAFLPQTGLQEIHVYIINVLFVWSTGPVGILYYTG